MGTCNRAVKFGLKILNPLGKMSEKLRGDFLDPHCTLYTYIYNQHFLYNVVCIGLSNYFKAHRRMGLGQGGARAR